MICVLSQQYQQDSHLNSVFCFPEDLNFSPQFPAGSCSAPPVTSARARSSSSTTGTGQGKVSEGAPGSGGEEKCQKSKVSERKCVRKARRGVSMGARGSGGGEKCQKSEVSKSKVSEKKYV